jgi:PAS domain S-box-containing protein
MAKLSLNSESKTEYIIVSDGKVTEISKGFTELTLHAAKDIVGKDLTYVFRLLRLKNLNNKKDLKNTEPVYIFTKNLEPRYVKIYYCSVPVENDYIYYFEEMPNSRLDIKVNFIEQLCRGTEQGFAIFSVPDLILLKANNQYLDFLESPFNDAQAGIGCSAIDIFNLQQDDKEQAILDDILKYKKTVYFEEYEHRKYNKETTYWNFTLAPIIEEGGVRYVAAQAINVTEKVSGRKLLEKQKKELEAVLDIIPIGLVVIDNDGKFIKVNNKIKDKFEAKDIKYVGNTLSKCTYFNKEGKELSLSELPSSRVLRGEEVFEELINLRDGGSETYHIMSGKPIFNEDGSFYKGIVTTTDVTESVKQTKIIEQKETELRAIIESMSDGLMTIDTNNKITLLNSEAQKYFNASESAFQVDNKFCTAEFYDSDGKTILLEDMPGHRALKGEKIKNFRTTVIDSNKVFHYNHNGSPIYDEHGKINKALICIQDVTDTINYEQAVKKQRDDMYKIFDALDFPISRISVPDLNIIQLNNCGYNFLRAYSKDPLSNEESFINTSILNFSDSFDMGKILLSIEGAISSKQTVYLRNQMVKNNKKTFNIVYQPVLGLDEEVKEILTVMVDVSHEVWEKEKIENVMKMQAEFFSFISHEFRTPLTTISSTLQLLDLIYSKEMTQNVRKYTDTIKRGTLQQMRLVNNLLDITRAEAGYLKVRKNNYDILSVTKAIIDSVKPYAAAKDIKLKFHSAFKEKNVAIDDEKYERILLNLISNAIKFTPKGKSIKVTLSEEKGKVHICVKDQGIGIPENKQDIIFERFGQSNSKRSRDNEGTGIGLYLVKLLVEALGGEITLSSKEGRGSLFSITLPDEIIHTTEDEELLLLHNNRLVEIMNIEFSNIYFE